MKIISMNGSFKCYKDVRYRFQKRILLTEGKSNISLNLGVKSFDYFA